MRYPTVIVRSDVLASWLTVSAYTRTQLARELGISKGRVTQLLTSLEEPSAHLIAKLMTLTRLPFDRLFRMIAESASTSSDAHAKGKKKKSPYLEPLARTARSSRAPVARSRKVSATAGVA